MAAVSKAFGARDFPLLISLGLSFGPSRGPRKLTVNICYIKHIDLVDQWTKRAAVQIGVSDRGTK